MTLSFSTKWPERMGELAGKPNLFIYKIHKSPVGGRLKFKRYKPDGPKIKLSAAQFYDEAFEDKFGRYPDSPKIINEIPDIPFSGEFEYKAPKLHTIREDPHNRWRAGMNIHFVINNRTKNRFQFAPVVKCVSVQKIEIKWFYEYPQRVHGATPVGDGRYVSVRIDGKKTGSGTEPFYKWLKRLAHNDGFDSVEDFFAYFNKNFKGKIIHWTDLKY